MAVLSPRFFIFIAISIKLQGPISDSIPAIELHIAVELSKDAICLRHISEELANIAVRGYEDVTDGSAPPSFLGIDNRKVQLMPQPGSPRTVESTSSLSPRATPLSMDSGRH